MPPARARKLVTQPESGHPADSGARSHQGARHRMGRERGARVAVDPAYVGTELDTIDQRVGGNTAAHIERRTPSAAMPSRKTWPASFSSSPATRPHS
jgi:hypothetical protein